MIVDDHPAMRSGLTTVLEEEPDLVPVGAAPGVFEAQHMFESTRPDVVMLDFHLPGQSSFEFVRWLQGRPLPPRVLLYSAHAGPRLALCALLAGTDGMLSKGSDARELVMGIRTAARGGPVPGAEASELLLAAHEHVSEVDLPLVAMVAHGASLEEVAKVEGEEPMALRNRINRILGQLAPEPVS
jgi:DNA-binding NarL/FixJ family response regulator